MKQECNLKMVWLTWVGLPVTAIVFGVFQGWWATALILIVGVFSQIFYVKEFPRLSKILGYGSVHDISAEVKHKLERPSIIFLFTANVCPFCPIVRQRLTELQKGLGFKLQEIDITFKPGLLKEKGFRSVPVIEMDGDYWVGNATSAQLFSFINKHL